MIGSDEPLRAVIYARTSFNPQESLSAEDQIRACEGECARLDLLVVGRFKDEAEPARLAPIRQGYREVVVIAEEGGVDVVVASSLDRLDRDARELEAVRRRLAERGVIIRTVSEGVMKPLTFLTFGKPACAVAGFATNPSDKAAP